VIEPEHADTKRRILDAAERLFARDGFAGTSIRAITGEAGVNLASANYHFGSKETLLEAVIDRRLEPLNRRRAERLDAVVAAARAVDKRPAPRDVLEAFFEPTLRLREPSAGAAAFLTLVGRIMADPQGIGRDIFLSRLMPLIKRFFEVLATALPDLPRDVLLWRLHFAIGSLSHLMRCHDRHEAALAGTAIDGDVDRLIEELLDYTVAGMEAPV